MKLRDARRRKYPIADAHEVFEKQQTTGEAAADALAKIVGSWGFIFGQSMLIALWMVVNSVVLFRHWDTYPFILMNLVLSMQAALTAPIIMMSQNRQAEIDRIDSHNDYQVNLKVEQDVRVIIQYLEESSDQLQELKVGLRRMEDQISALARLNHP